MTSPITITDLTTSTLAIIGFGNQARSWALNLYDSKQKISIGVRNKNKLLETFSAEHSDVEITTINKQWLQKHQSFALLIPDDQHEKFLQMHHQDLRPDSVLIYAHGFSEVAYQLSKKFPQFIHTLLAPKSIATELRENFLHKKNLAAVYSLPLHLKDENKNALDVFLRQTAKNLGITWGPFPVTFEQECKADLFSEQTLLCNILPSLTAKAYAFMVEKKIPWQLAYCEIFLELKLIINAMESFGPEKFFELISPNALMGSTYYQNAWTDKIPWDKLFDECWQNLENSKMIDYLKTTPVEGIRSSVMSQWHHAELSKAFEIYKKDVGKNNEKN